MMEQLHSVEVKPFLKWAGGKTQMLEDIEKVLPLRFNKYIEPFIGAGALFFHLKAEQSVIADTNAELLNAYRTIRDYPAELINNLKGYRNSEEEFYKIRALQPENLSQVERAARIIYLNKTCFNGLYRVNKQGQFNTPYGKRKNPKICDDALILSISDYLKKVEIVEGDFEVVSHKYAEKGDLVFLDPPYVPVSQYADFKRYTKDRFSKEDHIRLKKEFDRLVKIGAYPILTNSDAPFVLDLFKDYEIRIIDTRRSISSNPNSRKGKDIIVIGR